MERAPLVARSAVLFYLDNQRLIRGDMIARCHNAQAQIHRAVQRCGPATYAVNATSIRRTWP